MSVFKPFMPMGGPKLPPWAMSAAQRGQANAAPITAFGQMAAANRFPSFDQELPGMPALPPIEPAEPMAPAVPAPIGDQPKKSSVWSRIGDFMKSPEGRGALLRSGAVTLQGGLGAGIEAGAGWMDKMKAQAAAEKQAAAAHQLKVEAGQRDQQGVDQDGLYKAGQLEHLGNQDVIAAADSESQGRYRASQSANERARLVLQAKQMEQDSRQFAAKMGFEYDKLTVEEKIEVRKAALAERGQNLDYAASTYRTDNPRPVYDSTSVTETGPNGEKIVRKTQAPAGGGGVTATNPKTGEKVQFVNGAWVPLR